MLSPRARLVAAAFGALACALGYWLGDTYLGRLSMHAGYHLVAVRDVVRAPLRARPRRTLVAVIDGLRFDAAETLRSAARLRAAGQCFRTHVGLPTLSRPSYVTLSTGLEQDRTGARTNADSRPIAAESIWEVAREARLRVEGRSELAWWRELFPRGFDRYVIFPYYEDGFARPLDADLTLIHPVYVDEAAHQHGAASPAYAAAVRRVDQELSRALDRVDLRRDLVILTADHGHRDAGGHGGAAPEVTAVLTCFAGRDVARREGTLDADTRLVAPALSALLGVRLPRHLRAVEDPLDHVARILDRDVVGDDYYGDRLVAITRARAANAAQLRAWTRGDGTWTAFNRTLWLLQLARALGAGLAFASVSRWLSRRVLPVGQGRVTAAMLALALGVFVALYAWRTGGVDLTSLGARSRFIRSSMLCAAGSMALFALAHRAAGGGVDLLNRRLAVALAAVVGLNLTHIAAYGWPIGSPLPGPFLFFAPFLGAPLLVVSGALTVLVCALPRRALPSRDGGASCDGPPP